MDGQESNLHWEDPSNLSMHHEIMGKQNNFVPDRTWMGIPAESTINP